MLSFFGNTEDFYRRAYHNIRLDKDRDPNNVILEIKINILRWFQLAEINIEDPKQILEMFIIDNILSNASKSLFTFLKERKIRSEKQLISALSLFTDANPEQELDNRSNASNFLAAVDNWNNQNAYMNIKTN